MALPGISSGSPTSVSSDSESYLGSLHTGGLHGGFGTLVGAPFVVGSTIEGYYYLGLDIGVLHSLKPPAVLSGLWAPGRNLSGPVYWVLVRGFYFSHHIGDL